MKFIKWFMVVLSVVLILGSINVFAEEEEKPTASADISVLSNYVWRGWMYSDDSVVVQPSLTVGYKGFSVNVWANADTAFDDQDPAVDDKAQVTETDLTFGYDHSFGPVGVGVGYIYYGLDGIDDSEELYLSVGLDVLLSPTLSIYREIAHAPGWYLNFGLSHSFALPYDISLDLSGSVGYYSYDDDSRVEYDDNLNPTTKKYQALHDGLLSAGLTIPLGKYMSVTPSISYSFPLSSDADNLLAAENVFSNDSDYIYGGVTLSIAF